MPENPMNEKRKRGRPSKKLIQGLTAKLFELAKQGKTHEEMCRITGLSVRTLRRWNAEDFEFSSSLKENRALADDMVEASTYRNAIGYDYYEEAISARGVVEVRKHQPPNATSQIFWLKNRRARDWKDRVEVLNESKETLEIVYDDNRKEDFAV